MNYVARPWQLSTQSFARANVCLGVPLFPRSLRLRGSTTGPTIPWRARRDQVAV